MTDREFNEAKAAVVQLRDAGQILPSVFWTLTCGLDALRFQNERARNKLFDQESQRRIDAVEDAMRRSLLP